VTCIVVLFCIGNGPWSIILHPFVNPNVHSNKRGVVVFILILKLAIRTRGQQQPDFKFNVNALGAALLVGRFTIVTFPWERVYKDGNSA